MEIDPAELRSAMRAAYDDIIDFVSSEPFKTIVEQMYLLSEPERPQYVLEKIVNPQALEEAGVVVPTGIMIQRSSFGDRRPTLFVVKKYLPKQFHSAWENVNITFDQSSDKGKPKDKVASWRKPLPPSVQAALQTVELDPEIT